MARINYWLTFMDAKARLSESAATLICFDYAHGASIAKVPALGMQFGPASNALLQAIEATAELLPDFLGKALRRGVMTQALNSETRPLLNADEGHVVFSDNHYLDHERKCIESGRDFETPLLTIGRG